MDRIPDNLDDLSADEKRALLARLQSEQTGKDGSFPLSLAQRRLWFLSQLEASRAAYNSIVAWRLKGSLQIPVLEQSLSEIMQRQQILRTRFPVRDGQAVQRVDASVKLPLRVADLATGATGDPDSELQTWLANEIQRVFDLENSLPVRFSLLRLGPRDHALIVTMHHIVSDGWSMNVFSRELGELYHGFLHERLSPLAPLTIQYADYAVWQLRQLDGPLLQTQLDYWKKRLNNSPALLRLPTDRPRPAVETFAGARHPMSLSRSLVQGLKTLSRTEQATLFMTLLAAFNVLLYRYTDQDDIVVGCPIAGRNRSDVEGLIGFFVNTLAMRVDLSGQPTFRQLIARVREVALGAYAHQDLPFERLVEELHPDRDLSHNPVFQVMFGLQNTPAETLNLPPLDVEPVEVPWHSAKVDLTLLLEQKAEEIEGFIEYNTDLFDADTIERLSKQLQLLLDEIVTDPDRPIGQLSLLTTSEREQQLIEWNQTATQYPRDQTVHALFEQQVSENPDVIAVEYDGETLSYVQLNKRANRLAHYLQSRGVGPEVMVGVYLERGLEMVVGLLGILKAGGAYVPLDLDYPPSRISFMLEDAGVPVLLSVSGLREQLPDFAGELVCLDRDWAQIEQESVANPASSASADNLAYVIYTSGSTGTPKGVEIPHRAINRLVRNTDFYQVEARDRIAQASNVSFDAATFEIWGALLNGAQLVGVDKETLLNSQRLAVFLQEQGISAMFLTTALFNQIAREAPDAFKGLSGLMFGGEAVDPGAVRQVLAQAPPGRLLHVYGPTESTTFASWQLVEEVAADAVTVPIGRPLANTRLYILDKDLNPVPVGVPGELYIGGDGLARGYLKRAELSAEKFIANPFEDDPASRLYKTGDQVRYRPEGAIEYLGRFDHQVKLRGFRVEPGEIESVLLGQPAVSEAVVIVHQDESGDKRLVAYVVADGGDAPTESELREYVANRLPSYMVPSAFMLLDRLVLTANGKVDRDALPEPGDIRGQGGEYTAPRTALEQQLAQIWAEVLKLERVGIDDNFFDLGGHSLMATQAVSRIREQLNVELPLSEMFGYPTVAGLAAVVDSRLEKGNGRDTDDIPVVDRSGILPLSFAQKRLWFLNQLKPGNTAYNVPLAIRLKGKLRVDSLIDSLNTIVSRHEALRTRFVKNRSEPVQFIDDKVRFELTQTDLSGIAVEDLEQEIISRFRTEKAQPFDLAEDCLIRGSLLQINNNENVLLLTMHHIISDGWSLGILFGELNRCYTAFNHGEQPVLSRLSVQYGDYSSWQRQWLSGKRLDRQLSYWSTQLADLQALDLPTDRTRPAIQSHDGAQATGSIDQQLSDQLEQLSKDSGVTLFMTLLAGFLVMLHRYSGQDDIVIGTPIANRNRAQLEGIIGFFVNMLVMRVDCSGNPDFNTLVKRVSEIAMGAYEHQDLPFEKLVDLLQVERDPSRNPLFQVTFAFEDALLDSLVLDGLTLEPVIDENQAVHFDLECHVLKQADGLQLRLAYNTDLFDAATVRQMLQHYVNLLSAVTAGPDKPVDLMPMLSDVETYRLLHEWNETSQSYPQNVTLQQLFEAQVKYDPEAPAVEFGEQTLTYDELNTRCNQLAGYLRERGVGPDVPVGLYLESSLELLVGMLGILKAGGAYVPLDPEYPRQRLEFILEDTRLPVLLTEERLHETLPNEGLQRVCLDSDWGKIARYDGADLPVETDSEKLAYVIYTSGSTGKPKGVAVPHKAICNHMLWMQDAFPLTETDRVLQKTPFSFDASVWEFFAPLIAGARLVLARPGAHRDTRYLLNVISQRQITRIQLVPSLLRLLLDEGLSESCHSLKHVFCGGEALLPELQKQFFANHEAHLCNLYGPTETTIDATFWRCDRHRQLRTVPIGRPIANTQVYILDRYLQPVPIGARGEIYIGGAGLARNYLNHPEQTAERFIDNPFSDRPGAHLYKTGDMGRYLPDGNVEYLGRIDQQVKLRGFRIELGEIESSLASHEMIECAVARVHQDESGVERLVAYLVIPEKNKDVVSEVREFLKLRLPDYMVPSVFKLIDEMPLTSNGKVDFKRLPKPETARQVPAPVVAPTGQLEKRIAEIWKQVLNLEEIGVEDNFFDLGGDSFLMIQSHTVLEEMLEREIPITDLFRFTTIRSFAQHCTNSHATFSDDKMKLKTRASKQRAAMRMNRRLGNHIG